ncbi:MAG: ferritin family protein [Acidobacteriota bacterium]
MNLDMLTVEEILKMAVVMEHRGARHYQSLNESVSDPKIKDMLNRLTEDEKLHAEQFAEILGSNPKITHQRIPLEISAYLDALKSDELFTDSDVPEHPKHAIAMGIQAEKDSILLYNELYSALPPGKTREAVGKLLREEKLHLVELRSYYEEMQ